MDSYPALLLLGFYPAVVPIQLLLLGSYLTELLFFVVVDVVVVVVVVVVIFDVVVRPQSCSFSKRLLLNCLVLRLRVPERRD